MKAAVLGPSSSDLRVEDLQLVALGAHEVRVVIEASGVCRTDLSVARMLGGVEHEPTVLGHEGAGRVVEVGASVTRCRVGDRVIASFVPACGRCWHCLRDESNHCASFVESGHVLEREDGSSVASMAGLGTFAEVMTVSEDAVVPVVTDLPAEQLALIGCAVTTGVGAALWTAEVKPGSTVAVFGCGGVGNFVIQGARIAGALRIFAVDTEPRRRQDALGLGATDVIDPAVGDPAEQIRAATQGRGVDYAFEVVGSVAAFSQAYDATRVRGMTVAVGMPAPDAVFSLPAFTFFQQEKRVVGSSYGSVSIHRHFPLLVALAESGQLDIGAAVSRRIGLSEIGQAFEAMEAGEVLRSVIVNDSPA